MRIISLVPSLTEFLWALGLEQEVVGITKFCVHPNHWWREKTRVGGTKKLNFSAIAELQPTLIIANKEENTKEDIELLQSKYEVLLTDIITLDDAFFYLQEIGNRVNRAEEARALVAQIKKDFQALGPVGKGVSFLYFIWQDPHYVVGPNTYIHALLSHFGLKNFCTIKRYPELQEVLANTVEPDQYPDYIFLSSEPFPFEEKHLKEIQQNFPHSKILLIDGEICSWYGSRMLAVPGYLKQKFLE
jgi:ABC-type Fe3+-hydroxamate transport system substrate-binding protein